MPAGAADLDALGNDYRVALMSMYANEGQLGASGQ